MEGVTGIVCVWCMEGVTGIVCVWWMEGVTGIVCVWWMDGRCYRYSVCGVWKVLQV